MSRRVPFLILFVGLVLSACGGARTEASEAAPVATAGTEETAAPSGPCTSWDPDADPTLAPADVAAPPETARNGGDGLRFCILREGSGDRPSRESQVRVHYTGWTTDGEMFDSSHARGEPATFGVSEVIRGWTHALTHMRVGEIRRVWIPEDLAYRGQAGAPAGMLVFDIELIDIVR